MGRCTIEDLRAWAATKNGKRLGQEYVTGQTKIEWECEEGHRWKAPFGVIKTGAWCPTCGIKKSARSKSQKTFQKILEFVATLGGKCLSTNFERGKDHLQWECKEGHTWTAKANNVLYSGKWCPHCAGNAKLSIEEMREVAAKRGGKCLSEIYQGGAKKLQWQCGCGYIWWATPLPSLLVSTTQNDPRLV